MVHTLGPQNHEMGRLLVEGDAFDYFSVKFFSKRVNTENDHNDVMNVTKLSGIRVDYRQTKDRQCSTGSTCRALTTSLVQYDV